MHRQEPRRPRQERGTQKQSGMDAGGSQSLAIFGAREYQQGQGLVEFALSLALLVLIFMGIFDLGRAFNAYIIITNAAREGAYYGAMHPEDSAGIVAHVSQEAQGSGIALTAANVTVSTSGVKGTPMGVTVYHDFCLFSALLPGIQTIRLRRSVEMVIY